MTWDQMNEQQRIDYLVDRCNNHKVFSNSQPKFDAEFFQRCLKLSDIVTLRDLLNDMHLYFLENEKEVKRYKNFREHYRKLLSRRMNAKRYYEAKKSQSKKLVRAKAKTCLDCHRTDGIHFNGLYGTGQCWDCYTKQGD
jgi:hypothetical protein